MSELPEHDTPTGALRLAPEPATDVVVSTGGVQRKVTAASIASYVSGLGLAALVQSLQDGSLIAALPPVASAIVAPLAPTLLVLLVGYGTTNRVDRGAVRSFAAAVQAQLAAQVEARVNAVIDRRFGGVDQ